jgi:hypothetical protein
VAVNQQQRLAAAAMATTRDAEAAAAAAAADLSWTQKAALTLEATSRAM